MIECDNLQHDHAKFYAGMNSRSDTVSFVLRHAAINSAVKTKAHHAILVSDPEVGFVGSGICGLRWAGTAFDAIYPKSSSEGNRCITLRCKIRGRTLRFSKWVSISRERPNIDRQHFQLALAAFSI